MTRPPRFTDLLLAWFDRNRRDLPWRRTTDPWAIWISEIMLQQTRVETVRESYLRFLERFPTPATFAAATDDELMLAWKGLGYYRRARLLRDAARVVAERFAGEVPRTAEALGNLPGVGSYTRGAIASIAFGEPVPAIDGNAERVAARQRGITCDVRKAAGRRAIESTVTEWLDRERPGDFNQALMELGATICTPRSPHCGSCPVRRDCVARRSGNAEALPTLPPKRRMVDVLARVALVRSRGRALGARVPVGEPNAGQIDLPGAGVLVGTDLADLAQAIRERHGSELDIGPELASVRHSITHHRITLVAHAADVRTTGRLRWFPIDDESPWTTPARKVFDATDA